MARMIINRFQEHPTHTIGKFLLLNDKNDIIQEGYTLEPAGPDTTKRNKDRRIPQGIYNTLIRFSPKFKVPTPLLYNENVPHDRYILIHVGNYHEDTDGCILVGETYSKDGVWNSRKSFNTLCNNIKDDNLVVEVMSCLK